jgi:esterase/lipase superfamily enzyme
MFSSHPAHELSYASITVSIPPDEARKIGKVQWPTTVPGDPTHDFVTASTEYFDKKSFNAAISTIAKSTGRTKVLVFVHGFNNRFDEAVYRLAQIVQDSKAPVIPVLFSWPSKGVVQLDAYKYDLQVANQSRAALRELISTIATNRSVKGITVLCHSMGCWPALEGLQSNSIRVTRNSGMVKGVLLVAPDLDVDVFRTEVRHMGKPRPHIAVFASQDDNALKISKSIWGKTRLGDANLDRAYWSDFERNGIMFFDLTHLQGDAHSRAFEDITSVMGMIEQRFAAGEDLPESEPTLTSEQ